MAQPSLREKVHGSILSATRRKNKECLLRPKHANKLACLPPQKRGPRSRLLKVFDHGHILMTMKSTRRKRNNPRAAIRPTKTVRIPAGEFKARCLTLMDRVREGREEYIITKYGKAVARLVPVEDEPADIFGYMRNTVINYTDVITPLDEVWEAEKG